ncbi:MAG: hypothetical protein V4601_13975 [Pseudomonadota bacterium]
MIRTVTLSALLSLSPLVASAQPLPSVESVVVTGTRSPQALSDFVGEVAEPTKLIGKMARWERPVCVLVQGLNPDAVALITGRIQKVAVGAGARINADPKCRPNVQIVFTTEPQALVDDIRKNQTNLLGFHRTLGQLAQLATFHGPVQAWYMTATRDVRGKLQTDDSRTQGMELVYDVGQPPLILPSGRAFAVTGSRLGDGLRANLHHVVIIADPTRLLDQEVGPVADYLSMMALSQMQKLDRCQSLPSITNLLVADCPRIPVGLSDIDLGYLRGLYHMEPGRARGVQMHQIIYQMQREVLKDE